LTFGGFARGAQAVPDDRGCLRSAMQVHIIYA
jgi:hypothetical protein